MKSGPNSLPAYEWPDGCRAAFLFSADVDVETPFQWANRGKAVKTLGELEQRRFGARRGVGRLAELLGEFGWKGSFFVPGAVMESYPRIVPDLLEAGHEVGLHGYYHERMETLDDDGFRAVMEQSLAVYRSQGGAEPVGFRSPAWELGPGQPALLNDPRIAYDSSLMGFEHPYTIAGVVEIPVHWSVDDAPYYRYFGDARDTRPPVGPNRLLEDWIWAFDAIADAGGLFTVTVHPWMSGRAPRAAMLRRLFEHVAGRTDVWCATAAEIAAWHRSSVNADRFAVEPETVNTRF